MCNLLMFLQPFSNEGGCLLVRLVFCRSVYFLSSYAKAKIQKLSDGLYLFQYITCFNQNLVIRTWFKIKVAHISCSKSQRLLKNCLKCKKLPKRIKVAQKWQSCTKVAEQLVDRVKLQYPRKHSSFSPIQRL